MIPAGLIVWAVIFALRAIQKDAPQKSGATAGKDVSGRALLLACIYLPGFLFVPALTAVASLALLLQGIKHLSGSLPLAQMAAALGSLAVFGLAGTVVYGGARWLAWRVLRPLRFRRLAHATFWLAPVGGADLKGFAHLVRACIGPWPAPSVQPSTWATCASALAAERAGDPVRADRLVGILARLPGRPKIPRTLRVTGLDDLAWQALARRDWPAVLLRVSLARGRSVPLLRRLARAHLGADVSRAALWAAWVAAPGRRASLPVLRSALQAVEAPPTAPAPPAASVAREPWAAHVHLLGEKASGRPLRLTTVGLLARAWQLKLSARAQAEFRARALELGSADGHERFRLLRDQVLRELEAMAQGAEGTLADLPQHELGGELSARLRHRLFADVEEVLENVDSSGRRHRPGTPLEDWELWLALWEAVGLLEATAGSEALRTAWYGRLRLVAWNWACEFFNADKKGAAWAGYVMFSWVAELAERVGDEEAARVNRENVKIANSALA